MAPYSKPQETDSPCGDRRGRDGPIPSSPVLADLPPTQALTHSRSCATEEQAHDFTAGDEDQAAQSALGAPNRAEAVVRLSPTCQQGSRWQWTQALTQEQGRAQLLLEKSL